MRTCFVIMPISVPPELLTVYGEERRHFEHVFDELHRPAAEQAGYEVVPPTVSDSSVIQAEIIRNLEQADLVLCDISTLNANVFFELGIRVALDRPVALVRDDRTAAIPFDNAIVSCFGYGSRLTPWVLRDEVPRLAEWIAAAGARERNAMWQYFGITRRAEAPDPGDPVQAKLDVLLTEVAAVRRRQLDPPAEGRTADAEPPNGDFHAAVDRLLDRGRLKRRQGAFTIGLEPEARGVLLRFSSPPSEFVQDILREEAVKLGLDLQIAPQTDGV